MSATIVRLSEWRAPGAANIPEKAIACTTRSRGCSRPEIRLSNGRFYEIFGFGCFTVAVGRYPDGRIREIFLNHDNAGSAIGTLARDLAVVFSLAVQHGADAEAIRRALCRDGQGDPLGPLGQALDIVLSDEEPASS